MGGVCIRRLSLSAVGILWLTRLGVRVSVRVRVVPVLGARSSVGLVLLSIRTSAVMVVMNSAGGYSKEEDGENDGGTLHNQYHRKLCAINRSIAFRAVAVPLSHGVKKCSQLAGPVAP